LFNTTKRENVFTIYKFVSCTVTKFYIRFQRAELQGGQKSKQAKQSKANQSKVVKNG